VSTLTAARPGREISGSVPMSRLLRVELRKLVDTRSGRWLLVAIGVLTAAVIMLFMFNAPSEELTYENFVTGTGTPQSVLLPILGILTVTSEWGQRTGLVTFTLEPKRGRVVVAKVLAVLLLGLVAVIVALVLAAIGNVLGQSLQDGDGSWTFGFEGFRDILVLQLIGVLQGLALGMLIMNTAGAIVTYFALPAVVSIVGNTVERFREIATWVDISTASGPLQRHDADAGDWGRLAVAVLIWIVVPLALGWIRLLRRELKSA